MANFRVRQERDPGRSKQRNVSVLEFYCCWFGAIDASMRLIRIMSMNQMEYFVGEHVSVSCDVALPV